MTAGDSKLVTVTVSNVDLTGASVKWGARKSLFDPAVALYKMNGDGITLTTADSFTITLLPEDTSELSGDYHHEAEITDMLGNVSTILTGKLTVTLSGI